VPAVPAVPTVPAVPALPATPQPSLYPPAGATPLPVNPSVPSSSSGTWTYDPESRTTRLPAVNGPRPVDEARHNLVTPAVYVSPSKSLDDSGWRAARR
jgi:hypothetical protein